MADRPLRGGPVYALVILFGFNMVEEMDRDSFGLLIPNIQKSFHMTNAGILSLVAVAALLGLSLTVPIAQMADTHSRVRLMLIGSSIFALFSFGTGLAFFIWVLVIMRSGSGLGQATVLPTHNSLMSDWFPIAARPRVFSVYRFANALGAFVGPLMAGLLAAWIGWRVPFLVLAVPTVILVLLGLRLVEPVRGVQEREAMGMDGQALLTEEPPPSFAESWRMVWKVDSLRRVFYALPFLAASIIGFASLAALLYQDAFHLDTVHRAYIAAITEPVQVVGPDHRRQVRHQADHEGSRLDHAVPGHRRLRVRGLRRRVRPGPVAVADHRGQHGHRRHPGHRGPRACSPPCRSASHPGPARWASRWEPSG